MLDDVIDESLRRLASPPAREPTPEPASDEAVRAFQRAHPEDFGGSAGPEAARRDPAVTEAAIRHHLRAQARAAAAAAARRRRWQGHAITRDLPSARDLEQPLAEDRTVARLDGQPVSAAELERGAALRLYRLRGEIFRERSRNLAAAVDARLLAREAARRGTTEDALLTAVPVTDVELDAFIESERAAGRPPPARERARPYLAFRKSDAHRAAVLADLRARARIEVLLREPPVALLAPSEDGAPALGPAGGRRIVVFTNYRCRDCRAGHGALDRLRAADPTLRIAFRDFIPVYDPVADEAAHLARCAAALGRFEPVRNALLDRDPPPFGTTWYTPQARTELARVTDLDPLALSACLSVAADTQAAIERDTDEALRLGFDDAPAYVVDGVPLSGMQSDEGLSRALNRAR